MVKCLQCILTLFITISSYAQARLVLNNGGIVNITDSAFVVMDNPATNAITRNSSGHIISEGEFNRVKWNIGTANGTYIVPFGIGTAEYLPVTMTTSGAINIIGSTGSLTFAMYPVGSWLNTSNLPTPVTNFVNNYGTDNSAFAVDRFWRIEPTLYATKPALANLQFTYRDPEWSVASNAITEANLIAQRYNDITDSWDDYMPATVTNSALNTSTVAALPSAQLFSWWTLVDNRYVLPVELTAFNASCDGNSVKINWQTASESNNNYFEIERSIDAINFTSVLKINSQNSNSTVPLFYDAIDNNSINGKSYYRLKQVDFDGKFSYSSIVVLNCSATTIIPASITVFPNPTTDNLTVNFTGLPGKKSIMIYDVIGQEMTNKLITSEDENVQEIINVSSFAKATYILRIDVNNQLHQIIKFVKN